MNIMIEQGVTVNLTCKHQPANNGFEQIGNEEGAIIYHNVIHEFYDITYNYIIGDAASFNLTRNCNVTLNLINTLDKLVISIKVNSILNANFDSSTINNLNLTYIGAKPFANSLNIISEGSKISLNSETGFDMVIVINQVEYALKSESVKEISLDLFEQAIELIDEINSSNEENQFGLLQKYFKLMKNDIVYELIQQNIEVERINACINDNFLELAGVAKSLTGGLAILPDEMLAHICSFLKPSDINHASTNQEVPKIGSLEEDSNDI